MNLNIAYYEENDYHTEILATFLEPVYKEENIKIVVYNNRDKSDYVNYFRNIYNYEIRQNEILKDEYKNYDVIIFGTSSNISKFNIEEEEIKKGIREKKIRIIMVNHLKEDLNNNKNKNLEEIRENIHNIVLSKINYTENLNHYILPLNNSYNYINKTINNKTINNKTINKKIILGLVGRFKDENRDVKDLMELIRYIEEQKMDIEIRIYARHVKFVPNELINKSKETNKIRIYYKVSMNELINRHIREINYFIPLIRRNSVYHKDRLSGAIPFGYNYRMPLIMDEMSNRIYGLKKVIEYKESMIEVIDKIRRISDEEYKKMVEEEEEERREIVDRNNRILKGLYRNK